MIGRSKRMMSAAGAGAALLAVGLTMAPTPAGATTVAKANTAGVIGVPINLPINISVTACGNAVSVIAALDPAFGNHCISVNL